MAPTSQPIEAEDIMRKVMLSHLVQAQALGILLADMGATFSDLQAGSEIGAILEDIGNVYLDLSEVIAAARAVPSSAFA